MIAAAFIGGAVFLTWQLISNAKTRTVAAGKTKQSPVSKDSIPARRSSNSEAIVIFDTLKQANSSKDTLTANFETQAGGRQKIILTQRKKPTISASLKILPTETVVKKDTLQLVLPVKDESASLDKFFRQLEKRGQEFIISNKRDTIITGKEGTALLIPAYAFAGNDEVVITMKEFYSYEDIVTNKLSTLSNGQQLITGGMLHLAATVNGKEVDLQPGKNIRWFIPDTTAEIKQMQLFTGSTGNNNAVEVFNPNKRVKERGDTMASFVRYNNLNWISQSSSFSGGYLYTGVRVLDLRNEPFKTRISPRGKMTGFFFMAHDSKLNKQELAEALKEKYGYNKVKIRKLNDRRSRRPVSGVVTGSAEVGDSTWMDIKLAQTYRLPATDTIVSTGGSRVASKKSILAYKALFNDISSKELSARLSVDIRTMGWVNCDRFYNDPSSKVDYYVNLKDTAINYYTFLVFKNMKSMMSGMIHGNMVMFNQVPAGQPAKIISVGIQNGKAILAVKDVVLSAGPATELAFEATTPSAFKQEVSTMDE